MTRLLTTLAFALASMAALAQTSLADLTRQAAATEFLPVTEAYQLEAEFTPGGQLRLYWQITDGYYLYQHGFKAALEDADGPVATNFEFPPAIEKTDEFFGDVRVYYTQADLRLQADRPFTRARLSVTSQGCADAGLCYPPHTEVLTVVPTADTVTRGEPDPPITRETGTATAPATGATPDVGLWLAMAFAFIGGLILNAMPCVFPILSLKVLSFATGDPQRHHRHAWWYLTGVVASFLVVAGSLISLQSAGQLIGWGFQLQSTGVVIGLAYLFTAMGLSLSGLVHFGGGLMNIGGTLAGQGGSRGSFFTGVLAVVVASPCTAPFMGSALGYALTQPPLVALLVFAALGAGMASPMVLLSYSPAARRALPKPGPWMETLKELIAFPMYATAVWLLWVAGKQAGVDTMGAALAGIVALALGLYLYRGGAVRKAIALAFVLLAIALASWRGAQDSNGAEPRREGTVAWSMESLEGLRAAGKPVFVDVTADWCITCIANEQAVLFTDSARAAFNAAGVTYMIADWTDYDPAIGEFVRSHGRNGIPLYVMYPGNLDEAPFILPQLLTTSTLQDALARVAVN